MKKGFLPPLILFVLALAATIIFRENLYAAGVDAGVITAGNIVLFVVTILTMYLNMKAMAHANTYGFMRNVYGGFLLKFFLIIATVVAYIVLVKEVNKPALLICLGLYLLYTFFGTRNVLNTKKPVTDGNGKSTV